MTVTRLEVVNHVREHFGLSMAETAALLRMPEHPRELRDEFAMAALPGLLGQCDWESPLCTVKVIANDAYHLADAMLEARNANR